MNHLRHILETDPASTGPNKARLDHAALELAQIDTPGLDPQPSLDQLNELASQLADRMRNFNDGRDFVETAQRYLFDELGFHGNEEDFFDSRNSCLDQVLARRTGIPITLSLVYMEIGRRLSMPLYGIGLPRHFVLLLNDSNYSTYIDPYNGGRPIGVRQCFALAGATVADLALLKPATNKEIAMRMLQNLRGVYLRRRDWRRTVATLDLLLVGAPEIGSWYKQRGLLQMELKQYRAASADLQKYLALEEDNEIHDRDLIQKQIEAIHHYMARLN